MCLDIFVYVCIYTICTHGLTFRTGYVLGGINYRHHIPAHMNALAGCYKVGVGWGISSEGAGCFKPYEQRR